jgi:hypothetical protein
MAVRTTKITIETEGLFLVRQARTVVTWCPGCEAEVEAMLLDEDTPAAQLLGGLPTGTLHIWSPAEGEARVCLPSLMRSSNDIHQVQPPERRLANKGEGQ